MSVFQKLKDQVKQKPSKLPFKHKWDQFNFREDVHNIDDYKDGKFPGRYYVIPPNEECSYERAYPSATTILGQIGKILGEDDWLKAWKAAVGEEEADRISYQARTRGTAMHDMAELYMRNETTEAYHQRGWNLFQEIIPSLNKVDNIYCLEHALFSSVLQIAGRVDCVGDVDEEFDRETMSYDDFSGILTTVDFKSSRKEKTYKDIGGYKRQISLYAMAFEERTSIRIELGKIIMGIDTMNGTGRPGVKEFDVFLGDYKKTTIDEIAMVHEHFGNDNFNRELAYETFL